MLDRALFFAAAMGSGPTSVRDLSFSNVKLLLGFNGADGATATADESGSPHTITFNGDAQIDTAQFAFGVSSCLFDGTGDFLSAGTSTDWDISTTNADQFTIEFWVRPGGGAFATLGVMGKAGSIGNFGWWVEIADLKPRIQFSTDGGGGGSIVSVPSGTVLSQSVFSHVAIDKDATGKIRIYVGGVMTGSATPASSVFFNSTAALEIGRTGGTSTLMINWLDEIRITKGVARFASDAGFNVPTSAFPRS